MLLGEGDDEEETTAESKSNGHSEDDPAEDCGFVDGKGNRCILARHERGGHEMVPITETATPRKSRTQKEKDAVAAGKPRGFAN